MRRFIPRRFLPVAVFGGFYLAASFLLRLLLWWKFGRPAGVWALQLPEIAVAGAVNDLVILLPLSLPLTLLLALLPDRLSGRPWSRPLFAVFFGAWIFAALYLAAAEYVFFDEFDSRFNLVAVDYLIYPHEVLANIWDSYPVVPVLLAAAALTLLLCRLARPALSEALAAPAGVRARILLPSLQLLLFALTAAGWSTDTLAVSGNRVARELSANGVSSFFRAFRTNDLNYPDFYRMVERPRAFELVRGELARGEGSFARDGEDLTRAFPGDPAGLGAMNVVVIVEESLGAGYVGAYGDGRGLTPSFDRLGREGLLFRNAFATGTRTVRGLEAITLSFPPIPSESVLKRPGSERLVSWGEVMNRLGYRSSFLYGGYGLFDNMNAFFRGNGFAVSDRSDIPDPLFANIWGVSDEDLFRHALTWFDKEAATGRPFFSVVMTTSNHRPYTFPAGIPGVPPEGGGRRAGVRYADHALGRFFAEAPRHPWFGKTLFVVVADHDARVYGRAEVPVEHYRVPLLLYAPGRLKPGEVDTPASQMDIAPTVLALLGLPYEAPFYGQDVLAADPAAPRDILLNHNHDVALLRGEKMAVLGLNRQGRTFRYRPRVDALAPAPDDPRLLDLAAAYYQTAFDLFRGRREGS